MLHWKSTCDAKYTLQLHSSSSYDKEMKQLFNIRKAVHCTLEIYDCVCQEAIKNQVVHWNLPRNGGSKNNMQFG